MTKFRTRKAAALLAYLALNPGRHSRDKLLELFWPDLELDAARHALSTTLGYLRGPLEKDLRQPEGTLIQASRESIGLNQGVYSTDLTDMPPRFDPERLLAGFYDDWVLAAREKLMGKRPEPLGMEPIPAALTPYLGREDVREQVLSLLADTRLLTLVGTGGVGKTRLALETLRTREAQNQTVAWVTLSSLTDPSFIAERIVAALGCQNRSDLISQLRRVPLLLGVDNCEHLIAEVAKEVDSLLRACPKLTILATSREPLNILGETLVRLGGLSEAESALLFCERAGRSKPGWTVVPEEKPLLSLLCLRLDGLPLALELAAAKLRALPMLELVQRLDAGLSSLTSSNRIAEPRQQTLHATVNWSYVLLSGPEQRFFTELSLFQGGCTAQQAAALCQNPNTLELLDALVDKSLIQLEQTSQGIRYGFLETIHEFARQRLEEWTLETVLGLRQRHLELFLSLAQSGPGILSDQNYLWVHRLDPEQDNLRQALAFCRVNQPERAVEFCNAMAPYWEVRVRLHEQHQQCAQVFALRNVPISTPESIQLLVSLSGVCQGLGDWEGARTALSRLPDDLLDLGALSAWGMLALNIGNLGEARRRFEQVAQLAHMKQLPGAHASALTNLSFVYMAQEELVAARQALEQARVLTTNPAYQLIAFGIMEVLEGNLTSARMWLENKLSGDQERGNQRDYSYLIVAFGMLLFREGRHDRAARIFGASLGYDEQNRTRLQEPDRSFRDQDMAQLRRIMGDHAFELALEEGRVWSTEQALAELQQDQVH